MQNRSELRNKYTVGQGEPRPTKYRIKVEMSSSFRGDFHSWNFENYENFEKSWARAIALLDEQSSSLYSYFLVIRLSRLLSWYYNYFIVYLLILAKQRSLIDPFSLIREAMRFLLSVPFTFARCFTSPFSRLPPMSMTETESTHEASASCVSCDPSLSRTHTRAYGGRL